MNKNMKNRFLGICAFFSTDDLQTISPKTIGKPSLRGFGISFSSHPHQDVDKNELEDLAIGISKYLLTSFINVTRVSSILKNVEYTILFSFHF